MSQFVHTALQQHLGIITLDRPKALNSLSLDMVRALTDILRTWRDVADVAAVLIKSSTERAFCAGGDVRFFHQAGIAKPQNGSALLEDFFSEEYALNHLIHCYPKPYIALMDGIVMGGGMGIAQAGPNSRCRIVTERTKMAMPEVNIGLFPDVGGSYFLSRTPGQLGCYLGLTGETVGAADALYAGLADFYLPAEQLPALQTHLLQANGANLKMALAQFCAPWQARCDVAASSLALNRATIDRHFSADQVSELMASLETDDSPFSRQALIAMQQRSPLMMCVTLAQLRRGAEMSVSACLRMERDMVRRSFEHGEVLEGVRALVIDKDNTPRWSPPSVAQVTQQQIQHFFDPVWPPHAHPLRDLMG
jgi:enoyl-CoA hydratase/carnithine racemase